MSFPWLILHNVSVKKVRSAFTAVAVAVGVMTVVALGIVTESIRTTAAGVLKVGEADFTDRPEGRLGHPRERADRVTARQGWPRCPGCGARSASCWTPRSSTTTTRSSSRSAFGPEDLARSASGSSTGDR